MVVEHAFLARGRGVVEHAFLARGRVVVEHAFLARGRVVVEHAARKLAELWLYFCKQRQEDLVLKVSLIKLNTYSNQTIQNICRS